MRDRSDQIVTRTKGKIGAVKYPRYVRYQAASEYRSDWDPDCSECTYVNRNVGKCIGNAISPNSNGHNRISLHRG